MRLWMKSCVHCVMRSTNFSVTRIASYFTTISCPGSSSLATIAGARTISMMPSAHNRRMAWKSTGIGHGNIFTSPASCSQITRREKIFRRIPKIPGPRRAGVLRLKLIRINACSKSLTPRNMRSGLPLQWSAKRRMLCTHAFACSSRL